MGRCLIGLVAVAAWATSLLCAAPDLGGAAWIWSRGSNAPAAETRYFRAELDIPESPAVEAAEIVMTADNAFVLHVNGRPVGESPAGNDAWRKPQRFDLTRMLTPGRVVVAVEAVNTRPGPAGLLARLQARMADGSTIELPSSGRWRVSEAGPNNWQQPDFDDSGWPMARVLGLHGVAPWGELAVPDEALPAGQPVGKVRALAQGRGKSTPAIAEVPPGDGFRWPRAIAFLTDDCSLYRPLATTNTAADSLSVTIFNPRKSRGFPEHDLPAPMKVGRKLCVVEPTAQGATPRVLLDAGNGAIGSPGVTYDGQSILVSMVEAGGDFFHIFRVPLDGGVPVRLTDGPFHDIDPAELPDGRIVFTSTRIGTYEEYHSSSSRSLFTMQADGSGIVPLTHTIIFDNEPEVLADGRILFIRSDNFFDRGKVETRLHAINPDGTRGVTEFGLDRGPDYGNRLRAYVCGSPAPMPDGRLAFISGPGITIGSPGDPGGSLRHLAVPAGDVAALADGRLLCTTSRRYPVEVKHGRKLRQVEDLQYEKLCVIDPDDPAQTLTVVHDSGGAAIHSPVELGPRPRPPVRANHAKPADAFDPQATGFLFCQNARFTRNTTAGWPHVRAIRVLAGNGLTVRSSHSYIVHAGNEARELGTVPLAPDGSFHIEVPANTPLALQAVDAEGRSELNEMSWIYVKPGERRSCTGCHADRQQAPTMPTTMAQALGSPPLRLLGAGDVHRYRGNNAAVTGLTNLQFDRFREVASLNRFDGRQSFDYTLDDDVAALIRRLADDDADERMAAAQRLSVFREPAAAPALADRLAGDDSREVRVTAAMAIASCGTRESVPQLLAALDDPDPLVVRAAAIALENLTGHHEDADRPAEAWRDWLASHPWPVIEAGLIERLASGDRDVVRRAAVSLGRIGGEPAAEALRAHVARERMHNPLPEWRKSHRGDKARFNALDEVNPRTLQAAVRALGYLKDTQAVPMLVETLAAHRDPKTANLFLAEAVVEALGRIGTAESEQALIAEFPLLADYQDHTRWYGDHEALMACHAAPVHFFILQALDALASTSAGAILPDLIRSVPVDPDRALFPGNDDYESLVGRVIRRHGAEQEVVESCLSLLGDERAVVSARMAGALAEIHRCWAGHPDVRNRAAQILSLVCRDRGYAPRVRALFDQTMQAATDIPRVFDTGIPVVDRLPDKHWVGFYLARTLGNLADPASVPVLIKALTAMPAEAASGRPDPLGPGVLFLHNDLTPCWRAAAAWALGEHGDPRAVAPLIEVIGNFDNALDTRFSAAAALRRAATPADLPVIEELAADYPTVSVRRELQRVLAELKR